MLDAAEAQVNIASNNLNDTIVVAPFNGTLSMDDVNVGTYATAGTTALVTISSSDPIYVQFDMSESEYLSLKKQNAELGDNLKLRLSDGTIYGETGKIVQVNPSMTGGQLSMKAAFPNPDNLLVPGMYASIVSDNEIAKGSILIPTKALVQLLDKDMVDVVVDGKVTQKAVKVGGTYGIYSIIVSGIDANDMIIVDGQNKVKVGQAVEAEETTKDKLESDAAASVKGQTASDRKTESKVGLWQISLSNVLSLLSLWLWLFPLPASSVSLRSPWTGIRKSRRPRYPFVLPIPALMRRL